MLDLPKIYSRGFLLAIPGFHREEKDTKYVCKMDLMADAGGVFLGVLPHQVPPGIIVLNALDEEAGPER